MPKSTTDDVILRLHIALDAMRRGQGNLHAARTLAQAMFLTGFLAEAGYGEATFEQMRLAEAAIATAGRRGRDTGEWLLDDDAVSQFAVIATTHESQLRRAPLSAVADASNRLDRFWAGEPYGPVLRKRA